MTLLEAAERVLDEWFGDEEALAQAINALKAAVREERARLAPDVFPATWHAPVIHEGPSNACPDWRCRRSCGADSGQWKQGARGEIRPGDQGYERAEPRHPPTSAGEPRVINGPTR